MMSEQQIQREIVLLARPWIVSSDLPADTLNRYVLAGLAWALTGKCPANLDLSNSQALHEVLTNCGIPCSIGVPGRVLVDPAWLTAHGLILA
jgi:hypothetical protein